MGNHILVKFVSRCLLTLAIATSFLILSSNGFSQAPDQANQLAQDRKQKTVFARLEPSEKVAIWKAHFTKQLEKRSFTKVQQRIIKTGLRMLRKSFYLKDQETVAREHSDPKSRWSKFVREANANFSKDEIVAVFYRLDEEMFNAFLSSKPTIVRIKLFEGGNCTCMNSDTCCGMTCVNTGGNCEATQACGFMGASWCTGVCRDNNILPLN